MSRKRLDGFYLQPRGNATTIAYVELRMANGSSLFGMGIDKNIVVASLKAVVSGVNRALKR
ncbi:MAG: alpha-isopropylmalate synthase regulatory domain-containing protein [Aestuariivirga sp.]